MPQQRTGKQTFLLILSILKFLGAVMFMGLGGLVLVMGDAPEFKEALGEAMNGSSATDVSQIMDMLPIIAGILFVIGVVGIIHGIIGLGAS